MNRYLFGWCIVLVCFLVGGGLFSCTMEKKIKVLVVTGGHDYDKEGFDELLAKLPASCDQVAHPEAVAMLAPEKVAPYDVILLYDMPLEHNRETETYFSKLVEAGKGLVVLHHAFCSYDYWPGFSQITGGRFYRYPWRKNGVPQAVSTFKHDVTFTVKIDDPTHPVTEGVSDFPITDETYGNIEILPTVYPLLSTTESSSSPLVGWTHMSRNSRVVTLTLGHDRNAWENPSFVQILSQAITWTADNKGVKN